eukprot:TRINITY_DN18962_c0_g1_i1.p1 TRINITY_DN18962_c0_g1~~TRINITY_DN18962_c0_g1_i1.p1  ORF type:complete len:365 (-),score=23.63 TRINITY_DN18962_c0_g1_i1:75-1169(-)
MRQDFRYILAACFGISSWVTVNGIFSILPSIISHLPEGWAIAATLSLVIQAANLGPLLYRLCSKRQSAHVSFVVYSILALGAFSMLGLAAFWKVTMRINDAQVSVALILFTFSAAICDCTSSVVFWPFAGTLGTSVVAGLGLGENLSGVVAALVSWLGLSPEVSFCTLALVLLAASLAFLRLQCLSREDYKEDRQAEALVTSHPRKPLSQFIIVGLMSLIENAVLPDILPYATARYSQTHYHLASTIPVGPLAVCTLAWFCASRKVVMVMATMSACSVAAIWMVGCGIFDAGGVGVILLVLATKLLLSYSKVASMCHLKAGATDMEESRKHLETAGAVMQLWSLIGAIVMYVVVHFTHTFPARH